MKRIFLLIATNIAVLAVLSVVARLLGIDRYLDQQGGINFVQLLLFCGVFGFGGAFIARAPDGSVHISGEVIECDPPKKLTVTWNVNWPALVEKLGPTLVTYEIELLGEAVKLTMLQSHDRPISDDILSGGRQGWPAILSNLKSVLETGQAMAIKMAPPQRMLLQRRRSRERVVEVGQLGPVMGPPEREWSAEWSVGPHRPVGVAIESERGLRADRSGSSGGG